MRNTNINSIANEIYRRAEVSMQRINAPQMRHVLVCSGFQSILHDHQDGDVGILTAGTGRSVMKRLTSWFIPAATATEPMASSSGSYLPGLDRTGLNVFASLLKGHPTLTRTS